MCRGTLGCRQKIKGAGIFFRQDEIFKFFYRNLADFSLMLFITKNISYARPQKSHILNNFSIYLEFLKIFGCVAKVQSPISLKTTA